MKDLALREHFLLQETINVNHLCLIAVKICIQALIAIMKNIKA